MIAVRPTPAQVRAQAKAIREKSRQSRFVGIRYCGPWDGPGQLQVGDETFDVTWLDSGLAIRELLATRPEDAPPLLLLTSLTESELGSDVVVRLARRRLFAVNPWEIVRDLFKARDLEPSLADKTWIAEALIEHAPPGGYAPVPSGVLDAETVWGILLGEGLGLGTATPDAVELLRWTMAAERVARYRTAGSELREGVRDWLERGVGGAGLAILASVEAGAGHEALPLGLVCRVVFEPGAEGELALREAAVRLERYLGDRRLEPHVGRLWAAAAEHVVTELVARGGERAARPWLERADAILAAIGAGSHAHLSPVSLAGFEQRLTRFGQALQAALDRPGDEALEALLSAARTMRRHAQASARAEQCDRVEMAVRLVRWLGVRQSSGAPAPASFEDAATEYLREGGFVDWARSALRGGEGLQALSEAYERLVEAVGEERERENRNFGTLLAGWCATGTAGRKVLPIEALLSTTVARVAKAGLVLLVVVDGMSLAVWRELLEDVAGLAWVPLVPAGEERHPPVIAAFPTVTEVSRASLLCGRITIGTSAAEKPAFAQHPVLLEASKPRHPPVLFHKGELTAGGGSDLADPVRDAVASVDRRVVGVVLNAVDDFLLKSDQVRPRWTVAYMQLLDSLLYAARAVGRIVVLTSDHGHVLDMKGRMARFDQGDRWRVDDGALQPDEVVLAGPRVVTSAGERIIAPWSERARYGMRKNGYHGGATPQEVVVPLAVLVPPGTSIDGWGEASMDYPIWWEVGLLSERAPDVTLPEPARRAPKAAAGRNLAFEFVPTPAAPTASDSRWLDALLASSVYQAQRELAGRIAPPDARVREVLEALGERGGKLTRVALAHKLGLPSIRVNGLLAAVRRLLNVEGYSILSVDEASDTVELNRDLLRVQFGLDH